MRLPAATAGSQLVCEACSCPSGDRSGRAIVTAERPPLIEVVDLTKSYGESTVVDRVSYRIPVLRARAGKLAHVIRFASVKLCGSTF